MRALVMVTAIGPTTSCRRVPEGIAMHPFNCEFHLAMPVTHKRSVPFQDFVGRYEVHFEHDRYLNPCNAKQRTINPVCIEKNDRPRKETVETRERDAILAAQMLQSAVARELQGRSCPCNFNCDGDIGCHHCMRQDLKAVPGHMPSKERNASTEIAWIADTGSAQDLACSKMISDELVYHSHEPLELIIYCKWFPISRPTSHHSY